MDDEELLIMAAKASGIECMELSDGEPDFSIDPNGKLYGIRKLYGGRIWNPIVDDGDAFRLMVALNLEVERCKDGTRIYVGEYNCAPYMEETSDTQDILGAARRAIIQAAADIGRNIP